MTLLSEWIVSRSRSKHNTYKRIELYFTFTRRTWNGGILVHKPLITLLNWVRFSEIIAKIIDSPICR